MYKLLGGLKDYLKWQEIVTDNAVFRVHNIFTTVLLMTFSVIITANQFVGNPISCIVDKGLPTHPINTFCWVTSTFTMPDAHTRRVGIDVAHPGVGPDYGDESAKKYHSYYQWVCFVLFFQAMMCYTPKWLWDVWEGGLLRTIIMGLNYGACEEHVKCTKKKVLMDYLHSHIKGHRAYTMRYFFCEALCLVNIVVQLYLMDSFFDGEFLTYGLRVMSFSARPQEERFDPMVYVFPRMTKCSFRKFGPSGTIELKDSLCILPLNIVNEKTYIFLWFWYIILAAMLSCLLVYRALILAVPGIRPYLLHRRNRMISIDIAKAISRKTDVGDWWLLYMLNRNMDPHIFKEVVSELAKTIGSVPGPAL